MPEPYNDLELELKIATGFYNWVQAERAPEEIQSRFRTYCDLVTDAIADKHAAAAPAMAPLPGVGGPMAGSPPMGAMAPGGVGHMFPGASMPPAPPHGNGISPLQPGPGGVPLMPQGPLPQPPMIGAIPAAA
jgi:hypothetical protein